MSDNTTSNQSSTGDSKSTPGAVPSSTDGSSSAPIGNSANSVDQTSVSTDKQHGNQNVPQSGGAYSGQNYNANYQGYGNNPNYNNNYNNNNNNPNYYHKNQYNKNYTGGNSGGSGGRQNNYNNNANQNNNQRYNNNKKQYNNQKMNHHHHNQQQPQQQYVNYPYNTAAAAASQMYGYYMGGYQPVYGLPLQYGGIPATPGQQYPGQVASPVVPTVQPQQISTPPTPKIRLTTKDGKPVDLDEKKRKTASSTPVASPQPARATTVSSEKDKTPSSSATPATENKPAGISAAEEFKRKIRERAAAAAAAASKGKETKEETKEETTATETKKETEETPVAKESSSTVDQPSVVPPQESHKDTVETPKPEVTETSVEATKELPASEETKEVLSSETNDTTAVEKPKVEEKPVEVNDKVELQIEPQSPSVEGDSESIVENEDEEESTISEKEEPQTETETETETQTQTQTEPEPESEPVPTANAPDFTISQFLERLKIATPIDDILATKYPETIQGVDGSKQISGKKYRYDPQFLIQFRDVISFTIDPTFKAHLESLDIHPNAMKRSGSTRDASSRGGLPNKFTGGLPARFNGPGGKGGGQFDGGRQNSRSGSKRGGGRGASSRDKSTRKGTPSKRGGRGGDRSEMRERGGAGAGAGAGGENDGNNQGDGKPVEEVKPLEKSANRWVPKSRMQAKKETKVAEDGTILLEPEDIEKKTKSLLNKLTLEMFTAISDEIIALTNQSKHEKDAATIKQIISLTFAKACDEPHWSEMYAKLCAKMCTSVSNDITDESITLKDGTHASGGVLARRLLLATCQKEYEKGWTDKLPTNPDGSPLEPEMMSDEYYAMAAAKRRGLGLVKFIGHLYNLNMLNDHVIYVCLKDQTKNTVDPSDDSLENLTQLIQTVGPKLDSNERTRTMLKIVFDYIEKVLEGVKLPSRIKFMLMDLQDLREAKWVSLKGDAGPKTIEEIHRDAEIKKMEEERAKNEKKRKQHQLGGGVGGGSDSRSNSSRGGSNWNNNNNNNNNQSSNGPFMKKSPSFMTQRVGSSRSPSTSTFQNSDLQRDTSKRSEPSQSNIFAALEGGDDDEDE